MPWYRCAFAKEAETHVILYACGLDIQNFIVVSFFFWLIAHCVEKGEKSTIAWKTKRYKAWRLQKDLSRSQEIAEQKREATEKKKTKRQKEVCTTD